MKLSVVITAYNEEKLLEECLTSVEHIADEIIVVDNNSTDKTQEIARKFTKKIYTQPNDPANIDILKNFGFKKATGEWVLSLDADERVTPELATEIRTALSTKAFSGYKIPRKNIIFGKLIEHSLWWPDHQVRLFRRGKGEYKAEKVHQQLQVIGEIGILTAPLRHENYQSVSQYLQKMDRYTENEANALLRDNVHMHWVDSLRLPVRDFLKTFFLEQGYKDGLHGLILSVLQSGYSFLVFAKVWEKQGFKEENEKNFLSQVFALWKSLQKETAFWFFTELANQTKNPMKKIKYRILKKQISRELNNK